MAYKGIGASPGVALGKALVVEHSELVIEKKSIDNVEAEIAKLEDAVAVSKEELVKVKEKASEELGAEEAEIFEAHLLVLEDPELIGSAIDKIKTESVNAEYALNEIKEMFVSMFESMDNEYMKERAADIKDVTNRILRHILGIKVVDLSALSEEVVLIAHDLTPSDTATMNKKMVLGFLTDIGGRTSHTAIMSRTLEIAAIVGLNDITSKVKDGDFVVFNGDTGEVIVNPDEETINKYTELKAKYEDERKALQLLKGKPSVTLDGKHVELAGNIGTPNDIEGLIKNDAEGVGLYRTEFLYMDRDSFPTEEIQYEAYKAVLEGMDGKPIVIRTLDIGGDKELSYLSMEPEMNPFLGVRAIRLCFQREDIFRTQLRALLRASVYGDLRIMFPMIAALGEFRKAKGILMEEKEKLVAEGIEVSDTLQVGIMIEIPAAAILADQFAKEVDFFSIGTNDLIQYTFAADRMSSGVSYLYQPFNPSILRLVKHVIDAAHQEGKWVGMCGEMAGDQVAVPLLLGLGLDEFSMSATSILKTRSLLKKLDSVKMQELAQKAVEDCETTEEVEALVAEYTK